MTGSTYRSPARAAWQEGSSRRGHLRRCVKTATTSGRVSEGRLGGIGLTHLAIRGGESGYFARALQVYGRTGQPCRTCGTPIERLTVAGRSSHVCPQCQKRPGRRL
ncbi:zinc finger domain-containing protein [Brevibacterium samyangense]|uniref:zinc finger domain-containing protein n=1 Tax=Brevibacterium samyangense TaxID=366888 RepID=UPI0031D2A569